MSKEKRVETVGAVRRIEQFVVWSRVKVFYYEHDIHYGDRPFEPATVHEHGKEHNISLMLIMGGLLMLASLVLLAIDLSLDRRGEPVGGGDEGEDDGGNEGEGGGRETPPPPPHRPPRQPSGHARAPPPTPDNSFQTSLDTTSPRLRAREYWL